MKLIGLTGKAGSGKDTVASWMAPILDASTYAMAAPLKDGYAAMFGRHPNEMTREEKEAPIPGFDFSPRVAMQRLGTEWGRSLSQNIWVQMAEREYQARLTHGLKGNYMIITDVRFDNEAEWVAGHGGVIVRVERPDVGQVAQHASERGLAPGYVDHVLYNTGSLEDLKEQAIQLAEVIGVSML